MILTCGVTVFIYFFCKIVYNTCERGKPKTCIYISLEIKIWERSYHMLYYLMFWVKYRRRIRSWKMPFDQAERSSCFSHSTDFLLIYWKFCMQAYLFNDYWEDIGTIRSFFEANLALTEHVSVKHRASVSWLYRI